MFNIEDYKRAVNDLMKDDEFALDDKKLTAVRQTKESVTKKRNILGFSGVFGVSMAGLNVAANIMDKDIQTPAIAIAVAGLSVAGMKFMEYTTSKREQELLSGQNYKILNKYIDNEIKNSCYMFENEEARTDALNDLQAEIRLYNSLRTTDIDYQDFVGEEKQEETDETNEVDVVDYVIDDSSELGE